MTVQIDEGKLQLMSEALVQADDLVTMVIKGNGGVRQALALARVLHDLKRSYGPFVTPKLQNSDR